MSSLHINELLNRHPYYPYDKDITEKYNGFTINHETKKPFLKHQCYDQNEYFFKCMEKYKDAIVPISNNSTSQNDEFKPMPLYLKHVNCYYPEKVELMKCLSKATKANKEKHKIEANNVTS